MLGLPNYAFFCSRPVFSGISTLPSGPERPGLEKKEGSSSLGRSPIAMSANPKPPLRRCCLVCAFLACISFYCFFCVCVLFGFSTFSQGGVNHGGRGTFPGRNQVRPPPVRVLNWSSLILPSGQTGPLTAAIFGIEQLCRKINCE